jgi:hypothetical protein
MLRNVEQRKPAAIRRREVVDCFDDDLDCPIAGINFDANLRVCKIYFVSTTIPAADDGVGHASGSPWLPDGLEQIQSHSKSENFPGHVLNRQSSGFRIVNRIRVGTVDDYRPDLRGAEGEIARMPPSARLSKSRVTLILRSSPEPQLAIGARAFRRTRTPIRFRPLIKTNLRLSSSEWPRSSCPAGPSHSAA